MQNDRLDSPEGVAKTISNYLSVSASTDRAQMSGLMDLVVGGRAQSLFRHQEDKKKISKAFSSLLSTDGSKLRSMKKLSYTFQIPEKDQSYNESIDSVATDSYIRQGLSVTHVRHTIKETVRGGREDRILRHVTSDDGLRNIKETRIRYTFYRDIDVSMETKFLVDKDTSTPGDNDNSSGPEKGKRDDETSSDSETSSGAASSNSSASVSGMIYRWENDDNYSGEPTMQRTDTTPRENVQVADIIAILDSDNEDTAQSE